mmetsp:Transcript_9956/g.37575  ORF Transcript_9956/g.37575 Transcript_9956/m.37575 type:complete len:533 (+) Transcript_9956:1416-3014(+)
MLDVPKVGHAAELGRRRGRAHSHLLPRLLFRFLLHNLDDLADGRRGLRQRCPGLLEAQTHYPADRDHVGRLRQLQLKGNTVATAEVAKVAGRPATSQVLGRGRVVVHVRMQRSQRRPPHQRSSVSRTGCAKRESGAEPRAGREHDALLAQLRRRLGRVFHGVPLAQREQEPQALHQGLKPSDREWRPAGWRIRGENAGQAALAENDTRPRRVQKHACVTLTEPKGRELSDLEAVLARVCALRVGVKTVVRCVLRPPQIRVRLSDEGIRDPLKHEREAAVSPFVVQLTKSIQLHGVVLRAHDNRPTPQGRVGAGADRSHAYLGDVALRFVFRRRGGLDLQAGCSRLLGRISIVIVRRQRIPVDRQAPTEASRCGEDDIGVWQSHHEEASLSSHTRKVRIVTNPVRHGPDWDGFALIRLGVSRTRSTTAYLVQRISVQLRLFLFLSDRALPVGSSEDLRLPAVVLTLLGFCNILPSEAHAKAQGQPFRQSVVRMGGLLLDVHAIAFTRNCTPTVRSLPRVAGAVRWLWVALSDC